MAQPTIAQHAYNTVCKGQSRTVTVTFTDPTGPNNLVVLSVVMAGGSNPTNVTVPSGFQLIRSRQNGNLQANLYYYEAAPSMEQINVTVSRDRSVQVRAVEYLGARTTGVLDQVAVLTGPGRSCESGFTNITVQADEVVFALIVNRHASTTQSGFSGGLSRLFESTSPKYFGNGGSNDDEDRTRCTHHHVVSNVITQWYIRALLSSHRDWIVILCTFRGGTSGPALFTSKQAPPVLKTTGTGSSAYLSAFGPLKSLQAPPMLSTSSTLPGAYAHISPFNYQYRLGGWSGLLIGSGTPYNVEGTDGLGGWQVRTSDEDLPRNDGALRGIDLESARQILFRLNVGPNLIEQYMDDLLKALVPQRDGDWELLWRHPNQPLKMMRVRPVDLLRERSNKQLVYHSQAFALRASDPRHYAAVPTRAQITNTPAGTAVATATTVVNNGNAPAYPIITITGPTSGPTVTRVVLTNTSSLVSFDVQLSLTAGSTLIGDMDARVTGAPRSIVTLNNQTKYGAWQLPREAFRLDPDPLTQNGTNILTLTTVPAGAPITCSLFYRDTWAG